MIQQLLLPPFDPTKYENIPDEFRSGDNRWNRLCYYILDKGTESVRLIPRAGVNPDLVWAKALEVLKRQDFKDFHKAALAGWILWTGFESMYYQYD